MPLEPTGRLTVACCGLVGGPKHEVPKKAPAAVFGNKCKNLQPLHESSHDAYRTT